MKQLKLRAVLGVSCGVACAAVCHAQFGRGDSTWATSGADAQRSSWVRTDPKISKEGVTKPDFRFLWKLKLGDRPGATNTLTPAVLLTKYIGYRGFRDLALVESNNDKVFGIDVDLGRVEWTAPLKAQESGSCSSALSAGLSRPTVTAFPTGTVATGPGRGGPARSAVGEPEQGGVTLLQAGRLTPRPQPAPPPTVAPGAPAAPGGSNAPAIPGSGGALPAPRRSPIVLQVVGGDGMIHSMYVSNGLESEPPVEFLPPGNSARGFIVINNTAYSAASGCGGEGGNGIRAFDLASKQMAKWDTPSEVAGSEGPAFGPDGTLFVATGGGELVSLDGKTLAVKETYKAKEPFVSSPAVFQYRQRVLAVAAAKDGSLHLVDTKALGGTDGQTPLFKTAPLSGKTHLLGGAVATFQDVGGRRWILAPVSGEIAGEGNFAGASGAPTKGAIAAWQVTEQGGGLSLVPGWVSREIPSPSTPMVVNGVVFAASSGDAEPRGKTGRRSPPSVIYALDASGGKELWNSGKVMTASAHHGRLSAGNGQIYLGADDGTLYAFGLWIERQ